MLPRQRILSLVPLAAASVALLATSCANPGPPQPPSLHLPALATGLRAERIGSEVRLSWITPDKTSDGIADLSPITASVCRETVSATRRAADSIPCIPIFRLNVQPGSSRAADGLPPALTQDPPQLLGYRVELMGTRDRSAGLSAPAFALAGAAPPDPGALRVHSSRSGVVVEWNPQTLPPDTRMELTRALTIDTSAAPGQPQTNPKRSPALPAPAARDSTSPILLETKASPASTSDTGGLIDPGAVPHTTYTYIAQRIRTVTAGGQTFQIRSAISPTALFAYLDVPPPISPGGLESIATVPRLGSASIDLSWDASTDSGVTAYNVYRSSDVSTVFGRLNSEPVAGPAFRDLTAQPGQTYRYRVTAVDRYGNESAPSAEITDSLPKRD